jgi:hypothetical protein
MLPRTITLDRRLRAKPIVIESAVNVSQADTELKEFDPERRECNTYPTRDPIQEVVAGAWTLPVPISRPPRQLLGMAFRFWTGRRSPSYCQARLKIT